MNNNQRVASSPPPIPLSKSAKSMKLGLFERISSQDKIDFARHLAIIIKAGIPLYDGLVIIKKQSDSPALIKVLSQLSLDVSNGHFLADSLERYKGAFGDFFISVIRVGEASGTLAQNLLYLSDEIKKRNNLRKKIRSAMVYPTVILIATLGVTAFLAFFVFPRLLPMLSGLNMKMPASTLLLIAIVNFFTTYGIYVVAILIVVVFIFNYLLCHIESFRYLLHRCILITPTLSKLSVSLNMVNFARIFSLLLKSGIKIAEALMITGRTFDNLVYRRFIEEASQEIKRGGELAPFLARQAKLFPPFVTGMIQIGEATGNLDENLIYVSEYYEEEMNYKLDALTSIIEPVMLLFMGLLVGFVAISIITPIYSISGNI